MKIERFEDAIAWQKGKHVVLQVYLLHENCKDYGFRDQLQRAAISVMNNIAEGFERKGNREFKQFLFIAKGSCAECRSMLYIAKELGYISSKEFDNLYQDCLEISKLLSGLIKTL